VYTECLWLHEKIRGDDSVTAPIADLYTPPRVPKPERGRMLPPPDDLLDWCRELQAFNLEYLANLPAGYREHALLRDDYVVHFLVQHYSQHYETMIMALTQKALREHRTAEARTTALQPASLDQERIAIPAGHYRIGGERPWGYDNEIPVQRA
jgi:iron(II)-dependent oxidoreductase